MNRPPTYAKHVGRDVERDNQTIDLFAAAEPVKLRRKHRPRPAAAKRQQPQPAQQPGQSAGAAWTAMAVEAVRQRVLAQPEDATFTMEALRAGLAGMLPEPTGMRAWGVVTVRCKTAGYIEPTGGYAPAVTSNGSPKPIYRRGPAA